MKDYVELAVLIHWRIKPDRVEDFLTHWKTRNTIDDRSGFVAEFLSDWLSMKDFPDVTWHLDSDSLGDFKSFVTVGLWRSADEFREQIQQYFNDDAPLMDFEKYRRRRVAFRPVAWRIGKGELPKSDSPGVE